MKVTAGSPGGFQEDGEAGADALRRKVFTVPETWFKVVLYNDALFRFREKVSVKCGGKSLYPQTHVYFAGFILGKQGDPVTLGSILPDMLTGGGFDHAEAHSKGAEIFKFLKRQQSLADFGKAVLTHGFEPKGLDYYGDEKYLDFEKGYCFEKARPFISKTVEYCNIPSGMGWWKAHNIIEMGVELLIGSAGYYYELIKSAFTNRDLVSDVDEALRCLWKDSDFRLARRVEKFAGFIVLEKPSAESLAEKYGLQMYFKHRVEIDTKKVARLIEKAAESVDGDVHEFFGNAASMVGSNIEGLVG